ncbi:MAG TPA: carotenoid oxygenase family protein [Candidatus Rubrimentiphilum sp.]|nr:carotenoid oxygenase family protein [Candidatus Rubrimentiphilum sp.]
MIAALTPRELTFADVDGDIGPMTLALEGRLPDWLRGSFIRNGSARYSFGSLQFRHWFDGMAFLQRFAFEDSRLTYTGRFVRSASYLAALDGRATYQSFATPAARSFGSWLAGLASTNITDNTNVNVARYGDACVALTEIGLPRQFDPLTLDTREPFPFNDALGSGPTTAHPVRHCDAWINYTMKLGMRNEYMVWRMPDGGARETLARIPSQRPAYVHSMGASARYAILIEYPYRFDPLAMILRGKPFIENFAWEGGETLIHLIDLAGQEPPVTCAAEPFFCFHHVSAFDDGDSVVIDLVGYDDASIVPALYLNEVREKSPVAPGLSLRRYRAPLNGQDADRETLANTRIELPRVDVRAERPRYVYAPRVSSGDAFTDAVLQIDTVSNAQRVWERPDESPGEAIFVPRPGGQDETDGAVLFASFNARSQQSALVVLDAATFTEMARAAVPARLPIGFHGQFWAGY